MNVHMKVEDYIKLEIVSADMHQEVCFYSQWMYTHKGFHDHCSLGA